MMRNRFSRYTKGNPATRRWNETKFDSNGRIRGCSVYMLLCKDGDRLYIKVGLSADPTSRLLSLLTGIAMPPKWLFWVPLWSRPAARQLEREMHAALAQWNTRGEWFGVNEADKEAFNAAWRPLLAERVCSGYPMTWEKLNVSQALKIARHTEEQRKRHRWNTGKSSRFNLNA